MPSMSMWMDKGSAQDSGGPREGCRCGNVLWTSLVLLTRPHLPLPPPLQPFVFLVLLFFPKAKTVSSIFTARSICQLRISFELEA